MVGKKILLNVAVRSTRIFRSNVEKIAPKKREKKQGEKKGSLWVSPCGNSLKAMISFHILKFTSNENRDTQDVRSRNTVLI